MGTLWVQDKGNRHYVNSLGRMARNGAYSTSDGGYYFDSNGIIKTGGWIHHQSESDPEYDWWYYADADGKLASGWKKINNKWYYFYDTFEMNADEYFHVYESDTEGNYTEYSVYYFDKTGAMVEEEEGWQKNTYWFDGKEQTNWVYVQKGGKLVLDQWKKISNKWYYSNKSGAMETGWTKVSNKWYYMNNSGIMQTGWNKVSKDWYLMNNSGAMQTGWNKVSGDWYYMNNSGAMQTGWNKISGQWYYMNNSCRMLTDWQKIGGKWYYFYDSGNMAYNTTIDGYRLSSSGAMN